MSSQRNSNNNNQLQQYQPGEIVEFEGYKFQCYGSATNCNGPAEDWMNDPKGKCANCMECDEVYGHIECYIYRMLWLWNYLS